MAADPSTRLVIENDTKLPMTMFLEPWGRDYTLLPNQRFEVRVWKGEFGESPYFQSIHHAGGDVSVYLEGSVGDFGVFHDGAEIECGHNRPSQD